MNGNGVYSFCDPAVRVGDSNPLAFAVRDAFPVNLGHTLLVPRRHCPDFFQLTLAEIAVYFGLIQGQHRYLLQTLRPDDFNIGVNGGAAAGQSVPHAHTHLIPRFRADHLRPKGVVRHAVPGKGSC